MENHEIEQQPALEQPSQETIEKRKYLSTEIIQAGYNPEEFAEYISGIKEDGKKFSNRLGCRGLDF